MPDTADRTTIDHRPRRVQQVPTPPADASGHVLSATADGSVVELSWSAGVADIAAITPLTDSTGQTPDNTIANVPAITIEAHTALALTDTQIDDTPDAAAVNTAINAAITDAVAKVKTGTDAGFAIVEDSLSDLAAKVNAIIAAAT